MRGETTPVRDWRRHDVNARLERHRAMELDKQDRQGKRRAEERILTMRFPIKGRNPRREVQTMASKSDQGTALRHRVMCRVCDCCLTL